MAHNFDSNLDFGDQRPLVSLNTLKHPFVVVSHVGFRAAAIFFYVFANVFSGSFIIQLIIILSLLSADFYSVKNITGRLLVGLRWWNFVDNDGKNHWQFEASKEIDNYDPLERRLFWGGLVLAPTFWLLLVMIAFFTFQWQWMIVASFGGVMTMTNLYGYLRCKWNNTQEFTNYVTKWAFLSMLTRNFRQEQTSPLSQSSSTTEPPKMVETV